MDGSVAGGMAALLAGGGGALIYSDRVHRRSEARSGRGRIGQGPGVRSALARPDLRHRILLTGRMPMAPAGLVSTRQLAYSSVLTAGCGALLAYFLFGGVAPLLIGAAFAATFPVAGYRRRCRIRRAEDSEAWPRLIEEIRLRTGTLGRSIPQALFEAGRGAPDDWRPAFVAAEREWLLTTDFARTTTWLKRGLASPSADVVVETLLTAHEVGGVDLERWLKDLAEDRMTDLENRKDAATKQAGVRFARMFVLLVPLGMTLAGLGIGTGRSAYESPGGQIAVVIGILATVLCWVWSGRLLTLPEPPRVFEPLAGHHRLRDRSS